MTGGQWEVVGKTKKAKSKGNASKIPIKHQEIIETSGPIAESVTLYNALLDKEKQEALAAKASKEDAKPAEKNAAKKKNNKADKKQVPPKPPSIEEAFKQVGDLTSHLATLEALYPDAPLIYLKDITSILNLKLDLPVEDLTFASKPQGYPSSLLPKRSAELLVSLFKRCPLQTLHAFHEFCLQNMVQDTLKGVHTLGYRVMLQSLAREFPRIVLHNLPKCLELCRAHLNRQNVCLSVLWAAAQVDSSKAGFRVWVDLMLPFIASKNCTAFALDFLEKLLRGMKGEKGSVLEVRDLFSILDLLHSKDLPKNLHKRLVPLYPHIKAASYGAEPELRNYFPSYLRRLGPNSPPPLREEVLQSLFHCLEKDPQCYSVWRQLYAKHQAESACLLSYLKEHWMPSKGFPVRQLKETLSAFLLTTDNSETQCQLQELLRKLDTVSFRWGRLLPLLVLLLASALAYDQWLHPTPAESVTGKFLKDSGLLALSTQAGQKAVHLGREASKLVEQYVPWLRGALEAGAAKTSEVAVLTWRSTQGFRDWCGQVLPPLLHTVEKVFVSYSSHVLSWTKQALVLVSKGTLLVTAQVLDAADAFATWVQSTPEVMSALQSTRSFLVSLSANVQDNALHLVQLAKGFTETLF